jgi:hypothetical protein
VRHDQDPDSSRGRSDHQRRGCGRPATGVSARRRSGRRHHRRPGRRRHHRLGRPWPLLRLRPRLLLRPWTGLLPQWALLLEPPAILGRLGLARAARAGLRLSALNQRKNNRKTRN